MAITFDLPPELHEAVRSIAASDRRSVTQTLIIAVEDFVHRRQRAEQIDGLADRIVSEDAELLRRLA